MTTLIWLHIFGLTYASFGLAMLINPVAMKAAIDELPLNRAAMFTMSVLSLVFGAAVIATHQLWGSTSQVIVSIMGWLGLLKGFIYLAFPHSIDHFKPMLNHLSKIRAAGLFCLVIGAWMCAVAMGLL